MDLRTKATTFPGLPGVYKFYSASGTIIYVGKARNLKKRVLSYFNKEQQSVKTRILISKATDVDFIVVDSEQDALLLENQLIKKFKPRYNVLLKDDKSYPWICIKKEDFPKIYLMRNPVRDGSLYFGPYASLRSAKSVMYYLKQIYKIRTCTLVLSEQNIKAKKFKVCLEYHIGRCKAPCIGLQSEQEYGLQVKQIKYILRGRIREVIRYAKTKMMKYAEEMKYEEAANVKTQVELLMNFQAHSSVVHPKITNVDVFTYKQHELFLFVNYLRIINGSIVSAFSTDTKLNDSAALHETLSILIAQIRKRFLSKSNLIFVPIPLEFAIAHAKIIVPTRGDKLKLIRLSEKNCENYMKNKLKVLETSKKTNKTEELLAKMKADLHLSEAPVRIECYDNSNIQGTTPVSSCSVFVNAKPAKKEYRHYNVKTVVGANDFATFEEIMTRRFTRLKDEPERKPQLIIIDGGKGQLQSAYKILCEFSLEKEIPMIGIAKRLEEIYFPEDQFPIYLDKRSETLRVIQRMRDEAHRFGITFHRKKRSQKAIKLSIEGVKGLGEKTIKTLYTQFANLDGIRNATREDIEKLIGKHKTSILLEFFEKK